LYDVFVLGGSIVETTVDVIVNMVLFSIVGGIAFFAAKWVSDWDHR
jgi:hypothetical protein